MHRARCMLLGAGDVQSECLGDGVSTKQDLDEKPYPEPSVTSRSTVATGATTMNGML